MPVDKYKMTKRALIRFEKMYGPIVKKVFATANGFISRELTDGMVAGVPQQAILDHKKIGVVPIILTKKAGGYVKLVLSFSFVRSNPIYVCLLNGYIASLINDVMSILIRSTAWKFF